MTCFYEQLVKQHRGLDRQPTRAFHDQMRSLTLLLERTISRFNRPINCIDSERRPDRHRRRPGFPG